MEALTQTQATKRAIRLFIALNGGIKVVDINPEWNACRALWQAPEHSLASVRRDYTYGVTCRCGWHRDGFSSERGALLIVNEHIAQNGAPVLA